MSMPFFGKQFTFTQPDGTTLDVRGWGDQRQATFETLDGYTVVKDPISGFYDYATVSDDREYLVPTGIRAGVVSPKGFGLTKGVRISGPASRAKAQFVGPLTPSKSRWEIRREERRALLRAGAMMPGIHPAPPTRTTVGDFVGLTILVQFPDVVGTIPREEIEAYCNQPGYRGFGNNGSVFDYFRDNSGGKMRYTNLVTPYYTAKRPRSYYTNPIIQQPKRAWELIKEALGYFQTQGFDFGRLSVDDQSYVYATNVFYSGPCVNNWAQGLWPHSYHLLTPYPLGPGMQVYDYQMTDMGSQLALGTFCHENGHMICDFPDLYDYGDESNGAGVYCLMCAGAVLDEVNPANVCAYLKAHAGWVEVTPVVDGLEALASAEDYRVYSFEKSRTEYFLIENRVKSGRDKILPGSGLIIWHVDELGSNNEQAGTPTTHYECALEQADGRNDLERRVNQGDPGDFFPHGSKNRFGADSQPSSRWWDGTPSGLTIRVSEPAGATTPFKAKVQSGSAHRPPSKKPVKDHATTGRHQ